MNLLTRSSVERVLIRFQTGEISLDQAARNLLDMPQIPDFEGVWEMLIIHTYLAELALLSPRIRQFRNHWKKEIRAWQQRLGRFLKKPKPSFRNAIRKDFEQAHRNLHKNDAMKLILNVEIHLEEVFDLDEISVSDMISDLKLERNAMKWFLEYD